MDRSDRGAVITMKGLVAGSWAVFLLVLSCLTCGRAEVALSSSYLEGLSTLAKALQTPKLNESGTFVIATAVNFGYLHHLQNFDCFMKQLELPYLVFALDAPTHANLTSGINKQLFHSIYLQLPDENDTSTAASDFRTLDFNIITARKIIAVLSLLRVGMDVLFLDADVALLRDPTPYLFWNNVQYVHSLNYPCDSVDQHWGYFHNRRVEGNTGFYFVRSSPQMISVWEEVYTWMKKSYRIDDQTFFWKVLRGLEDRTLPLGQCRHLDSEVAAQNITLCMVNSCLFSSGMLSTHAYHGILLSNLAAMNETPVSIHANFIKTKDKKVQALQNYHLWLVDGYNGDGSHNCRAFSMATFLAQQRSPRRR